MKKVIELIRVSTEMQAGDDRASIPAQRTINRRTAAGYGLEIVKSIEISDVSGAAVLLAPEIQELLRLIASADIHGVVAREFSRLMRPEDFGDYVLLQTFAETQTVLYLPDGPIDFSNKTGRLLGTIRAAIAGMERSEILERVWAGKEEKRRNGKLAVSPICLPYGVGYDKAKQAFYYKEEASKIRDIVNRIFAGELNYTAFAKYLGVHNSGVPGILRNPIYSGWRVIDEKRDPSPGAKTPKKNGRQGDRRKIKRAPEDVIRYKVIDSPIITEDEHAKLIQMMDIKLRKHWKTDPQYACKFTYNGYLVCAACGQPIQTVICKDHYYLCKTKRAMRKSNPNRCESQYMRGDVLDAALDELICEKLTDGELIYEIAEGLKRRSENSEQGARITRLESQIINLQAKRQRIVDSFIEGILTKPERDTKLTRISQELDVYQDILIKETPSPEVEPTRILALFAVFTEWNGFNREEKRRTLSALMPEIRVANYRIYGVTVLTMDSGNSSLMNKGQVGTIHLPLDFPLTTPMQI